MRKILFFAAAAVFFTSAIQAQDVMKQTGGEQNLEVLFAPLGGSPIGINGIKYRKFTSATSAIRAEVFLGFNSSSDIALAGNNVELKSSSSQFDISIAPGIERHFAGTDRLSPYVGGVVLIGFSSMTDKDEQLNATQDGVAGETKTTDGSLTFGANAVAGVDFYFSHHIYLGAELGFGLAFTTEFDSKFTPVEGDEVTTPNGNSFGIGPNVVGAIRAGFLF
jgi:opacity protein-like surface antigen